MKSEERIEDTVEATEIVEAEEIDEAAVEPVVDENEESVEEAADESEEVAEEAADESEEAAEETADEIDEVAEETADESDEVVEEAADESEEVVEEPADESDEVTDKMEDAEQDSSEEGDASRQGGHHRKHRMEAEVKAEERKARAAREEVRKGKRYTRMIRNRILSIVALVLFFAALGCGIWYLFTHVDVGGWFTKLWKVSAEKTEELQSEALDAMGLGEFDLSDAQPKEESESGQQIEDMDDLTQEISGNDSDSTGSEVSAGGSSGEADASETGSDQQEIIDQLIGEEDELIAPPDETEAEPTYEEKLEEVVEAAVGVMSLQDKVAGLFLVTPEGLTGVARATKAGDGTKTALESYPVGGILYASKNVVDKDQFSEMLLKTTGFANYPTFFAVTEEGGSVSTLATAGLVDREASPADVTASGDVTTAYNTGLAIASNLTQFGLDLTLAPVADLCTLANGYLSGRTYGTDVATTTSYVNSLLQGLSEGGVDSCIKFFPGLGAVSADPAKGRVVDERSREDIENSDFLVYRALIASENVKMIMMGNTIVPTLDENNVPSSLSESIVTGILRNDFGYNGVILSGRLDDAAVSQYYGSGEAAVLALRAGCDMLLCPENFTESVEAILKAVEEGTISEARIDDAIKRVYRIKYAGAVERE